MGFQRPLAFHASSGARISAWMRCATGTWSLRWWYHCVNRGPKTSLSFHWKNCGNMYLANTAVG